MKCKNCNINEAKKYSQYSSGEFCSKSCSTSFSTKNKRLEINKKVSIKLKDRKKAHKNVVLFCPQCNREFEVLWKKRKQKFCSKSCSQTNLMNNGNKASEMGKRSVYIQRKTRRSKNEIYFGELCKNRFKNVKFNEPIFNGWDADIIIEDLKLAILWNGAWHYKKITNKHSLKQVENRDKIKQEEITKTGYNFYIIKDMGKHSEKFVEKKFQEMLVFLKLNK